MKKLFFTFISISFVFITMTGCATKKYVNRYVDSQVNGPLEARLGSINSEIESTQSELDNVRNNIELMRQNITENNTEIVQLKDVTEKQQEEMIEMEKRIIQEAIRRAEEAAKMDKPKLLYEVTISEEAIPFAYAKSKLSDDAKAAISVFADYLVKENKEVYIEIQGHTDNIGAEEYNLELGEKRAEAVRRYLHLAHNIPLNRMCTFSYGESQPVDSNDTPEDRARNRRVVILVMSNQNGDFSEASSF